MTRATKRITVIAIPGFAVAMVLAALLGPRTANPQFYILSGIGLVVVSALFYLFDWQLADDVHDTGDGIVVARGGQQHKFALADLGPVERHGFGNSRWLTLRFRKDSEFGDSINFRPARGIGEPERTELNRRIMEARDKS